jgi:hypothetical protein
MATVAKNATVDRASGSLSVVKRNLTTGFRRACHEEAIKKTKRLAKANKKGEK